ncbi:hypothetical protein EXW72_02475 [Pseudomonas sp. BCA14]|uniref:hypothetical protein n=1 Tax=unclassified Pseudomonas TaxID=196821 RepID=UPI00106E5B4F|nr:MULTISPECIES: hypothetical protein [unclassified Pseudomonas]TFF13180.1 hypothetical protein EXW70_01215 [Pseudomonas sp. JMN1]TFF16136.1 hypothetical protein EXW71_07825 [Pseudomonas sp. BCA17]TFF30072.1 hypothetical protein EXW73_07060 [Pseudomonas sp. BCA13]TFF30914.1 hypothetical protein EXW72_02475 [Pseudomonas sp. BCA14]
MQIGNSGLNPHVGVRLPAPVGPGFGFYRPSLADRKLIEAMIKHFSALEDPGDKGYITLESLKHIAYPRAGRRDVPPALQQIARDFLNHDVLRVLADRDPYRRLDDKYDRENLNIVLKQAHGPTVPLPRPYPGPNTPGQGNYIVPA